MPRETIEHSEGVFEVFDFEADAWDWLAENGFVQRTSDHRQFDHRDGRWAILVAAEEGELSAEIKVFRITP